MQEPYREGVAIHSGLEPCAVVRKGRGEASVEVRAGRVLSREMLLTSGRRRCQGKRKATSHASLARDAGESCAVGDPAARTETPCTEPGRSRGRPWRLATVRAVNPQGARQR